MVNTDREDGLTQGVWRAKGYVQSLGYKVAFLSIYGSQNYGLDVNNENYQSDVDYKCVIVPTLRDLVNDSKPLSTCIEFEGGQIDIKDIRVFTDTLVKCNPAYIETLYSEFSYGTDDFYKIRAERLALITEMAPFFARAAHGMAMEKRTALCHPYPSIKDKIDKYGYDPKQLHHIARLGILMSEFLETGKLNFIPNPEWRTDLIELKIKPMPLQMAIDSADNGIEWCAELRTEIEKKYAPSFESKLRITKYARELIYNSIKNENMR